LTTEYTDQSEFFKKLYTKNLTEKRSFELRIAEFLGIMSSPHATETVGKYGSG
jgi:hypothetical protein